MAKKRPSRVKTVRTEDFTPLEIHAIQIREYYLALRKAGFDVEAAQYLCAASAGWPDWFTPNLPEHDPYNPDFSPYEEDDDD
jgi:hypothetical protein